MSGSSSAPGKPPKTMSSRLMTMKFMQRAAASSPSPSEPEPDEHSTKRRKVGLDTPPQKSTSELGDIQFALRAEEAKRAHHLERLAAEAGETRWVFSFKDAAEGQDRPRNGTLQVVSAGFASIDVPARHVSDNPEDGHDTSRTRSSGRKVFGNLKGSRKENHEDSSDADGSETSGDDEEGGGGADDLIRATQKEAGRRAKAERKVQRKAAQAEAAQLAEKRRSKQVKLSSLKSISGAGGGGGGGSGDKSNMVCYICNVKGHMARECPHPKNRKNKR
ncbi:MAG: hypothetical protein M1817_000750 [Caeruleum heppii]|nr:MAG: hypothetical protein M1817_000750 [Caeruleum heppii]